MFVIDRNRPLRRKNLMFPASEIHGKLNRLTATNSLRANRRKATPVAELTQAEKIRFCAAAKRRCEFNQATKFIKKAWRCSRVCFGISFTNANDQARALVHVYTAVRFDRFDRAGWKWDRA
jgi:xanthine dehydrogenase molybdopterin-binding subunit B